jgi:hypothetical protein
MILKLRGIFSYIDGKKLHFTFIDEAEDGIIDDSKEKLKRAFSAPLHVPYSASEFIVGFSSQIPPDILALVGRQVNVYVKGINYSFTSPLAKNKGQKIQGVRLTLENITAITKL